MIGPLAKESVRPQVLRLITRLNIGGPAIQALMLTRELRDEFPTVLAAGRAPDREGELSDPLVYVRCLPLQREINPVIDFRALRATRRLADEIQPRIIHTHMAKAGTIGRVSARMMRPRPRTVHTFHGHVLEGYFNRAASHAFLVAERSLAKRTDVLIGVSDDVRDRLLDLGIGTPHQWRVIPLGLDLDPFLRVRRPTGHLRKEVEIPPGVSIVGSIGRLAAVKDVMLLMDSVARLAAVSLVIVGDGEEREALERRAGRPDLIGRVHFLGWRRDIPALLPDMDVVALTSINEGTPVSLIEALASARAVVATDVGGVGSVVQHDETGLLTKSRTPQAIASLLCRALEDKDLRERLGREGRARVARRFTQTRLVSDIRSLYDELSR